MHTLFHFSCRESRCSLSLSRYRRWCCQAVCWYIIVVQVAADCLILHGFIHHYPSHYRSLQDISFVSSFLDVTCWTVNLKQKLGLFKVIYQHHYSYSPTCLQFTKQWATVFSGSCHMGPCDIWCLSLRRRSRKEKLDILDAGGLLLGLASFFLQIWSDGWEVNLGWLAVEARDHHKGTP